MVAHKASRLPSRHILRGTPVLVVLVQKSCRLFLNSTRNTLALTPLLICVTQTEPNLTVRQGHFRHSKIWVRKMLTLGFFLAFTTGWTAMKVFVLEMLQRNVCWNFPGRSSIFFEQKKPSRSYSGWLFLFLWGHYLPLRNCSQVVFEYSSSAANLSSFIMSGDSLKPGEIMMRSYFSLR